MERHRNDRDNHRDRDYHNRDRDRDRDRDFHRRPSRFTDGPPPGDHNRRSSPSSFRVNRRAFDSPPQRGPGGPGDGEGFRPPQRGPGGTGDGEGFRPPQRGPGGYGDGEGFGPPQRGPGGYGDGEGFRPPQRGPGGHGEGEGFYPPQGGMPGGFWPVGGDVGGPTGGFGNDFGGPPRPMMPPQPLSGQKRGFPFSGRGGSPEHFDWKSFVKLFVGSVPRTVTEEEIRPLFEEQGKVLEVALIKDKRTGEQQGCCFIKYATSEDADRAIKALHNQYTLPGGVAPIQVRYADGERERLGTGAVEFKLFVGSLNRLATEKEVEEIFAPYGRIEDVYLMRDERKQSRGCGFVKFSDKDSAMAAINALHGIYTMRGCDQPLIVRFADPKRPRAGDSRAGPAFGGPGFGPSPPSGIRPAGPNFPGPMGGHGRPNSWQPISPQNLGPSVGAGYHGFGNEFPRSGDAPISSTPGAHGPQASATEVSLGGAVSAASASPQNFNQAFPPAPPSGQQISPMQKPLESPQNFPPPLQLHQGQGTYSQAPASQTSMRPPNSQTGYQTPYSQPFPSQQLHGATGHVPYAQFHAEQSAANAAARPNVEASLNNSQLPTSAPQQPLYQQSPSQITQMLSQQRQTLQASFQSSKLAFSQLQQQAQMMQPSIQNQPAQQNFQASRQQWTGPVPVTSSSASVVTPSSEAPSTSSASSGSAAASRPAPVKCNWTEHTSPDGYKYYYNSVTGESRWYKPEELTLYEQQQQKVSVQPSPNQPSLQAVSNQQVPQSQQPQLHSQFRYPEQFQHPQLPSMYQAPRAMGNMMAQEATYPPSQAPANSFNDVGRFQQGTQAAQDWAWKSNTGGT